jgi:hypothetical protein
MLRSWLLLPLSALVVSCQLFGTDAPAAVDRSSGPLADEHYQWTSGSGIDLLTGPAVPVRAFIESRLDAQTMHSLEYAYPGFDRAVVKPADDNGDALTSNLRPDVTRGTKSDTVRVGNNRFGLQAITRNGDTVIATVCNYRYGLALKQDNGAFVSVVHGAVDDDGIDVMQVRLTAPSSDEALPPQEGQAVAPAVDVFGDWKVTGFLVSYGGPDAAQAQIWPTRDKELAQCVASAPDSPDRRASLVEGEHPREDFPTTPPVPGWPKPSSG